MSCTATTRRTAKTTSRRKAARAGTRPGVRRASGRCSCGSTALAGLPHGLTPAQFEFCLNYLANGFNATAAYKAAYPGATPRSARELGHRLLTKVDIKAFLATQLAEGWKALQMDGDEALARVAMDARADPRLLFDEHGKPLSPDDWPDEIANSVETLELHEDGGVKRVKFASKAAARRTILEITGRVRGAGDDLDALAEAIRADQARCSKV